MRGRRIEVDGYGELAPGEFLDYRGEIVDRRERHLLGQKFDQRREGKSLKRGEW